MPRAIAGLLMLLVVVGIFGSALWLIWLISTREPPNFAERDRALLQEEQRGPVTCYWFEGYRDSLTCVRTTP